MTFVSTNTPINLAVLDMAGTTIADNGIVERSVNKALSLAGIGSLDPQALLPLRGLAKNDMFAQLAPNRETAEEANRHFNEVMIAAVANGDLPPKDGATEVLAALRSAGIKTCLMTGFDPKVMDALLDLLDWRDMVDLTVAQSGSLRGRPFPDLILSAALTIGVTSVQSVFVAGDTVNDLLAGTRSGASRVVGVLGGAHDRAKLESAPHTQIVANLPAVAEAALAV